MNSIRHLVASAAEIRIIAFIGRNSNAIDSVGFTLGHFDCLMHFFAYSVILATY